MELKIKDIVDLLQISEKTIYRWIKDKKIPCYRINHQFRFNRAEINEWILSNKIELSSSLRNISITQNPYNLAELLEKGGIISDVPGKNVREVLQSAINKIYTPADLSKEDLFTALMSREEMMPTAIGHGIAIPHPRSPIVTVSDNASVSICYLDEPLDFGALDGQEVHTLFILLTESPRRHLDVLSRISYLCHDAVFLEMLKNQSQKENILNFVRMKELEWNKKENES